MKKLALLILAFIAINNRIQAQSNPYRSTYLKLGINSFGKALDNSLSPKDNILDGRFGATSGYVLEVGHIFYFGKKNNAINYGLDWTIVSFTYNKMNKWNAYATAAGYSADETVDGSKTAASISSKIGPVISFIPVEKLVIDVHAQVAPVWRGYDFNYDEYDENEGDNRYFSFTDYSKEDENENYNAESVKNHISFGIGANFGVTVRRGIAGLSLDYFTGKTNTNYDANDGQGNHTHGKTKLGGNNVQLKLSLNF